MSTPQQIARLREATGLGWLDARLFLLGKPSTLCERIIAAKETQSGRLLHDPIEDDPSWAKAFAEAKVCAEKALAARLAQQSELTRHKGSCHLVWRTMKQELLQKHGIEWFSPREMNPGIKFD